jgi:purine-binding chemotaxis protein CheW
MEAHVAAGTANPPTGHSPGTQFLTFYCADEEYGVDILRVREIKGWPGVTSIPEAPSHVLGIMNLRGDIVPVIDLRTRFGLDRRTPDASTVLIIVSAATGKGQGTVGICVDAVSDVHGFAVSDIKETPDVGNGDAAGYLSGVVSRDSKILMLLDIDRVIGTGLPTAIAGQ